MTPKYCPLCACVLNSGPGYIICVTCDVKFGVRVKNGIVSPNHEYVTMTWILEPTTTIKGLLEDET